MKKEMLAIAVGKPEMEDGGMESEGVEPEFKAPKGYTPPDDAREGVDIPVLAHIRSKGNGMYCLVSLDGAPFDPDKDMEENEGDAADQGMVLDEETPVDKSGDAEEGLPEDSDKMSLSEKIANVRKKMAGSK